MKPAATLFLVTGVLLLAALFWWLRPSSTPTSAALPAPAVGLPALAEAPAVPPPLATPALVAELHLVEGRVPGIGQRLQVPQGGSVQLTLHSDRGGELHLHGYDQAVAIRAGEPAVLAFTADRAGRFELEVHTSGGGHIELGALEVLPP